MNVTQNHEDVAALQITAQKLRKTRSIRDSRVVVPIMMLMGGTALIALWWFIISDHNKNHDIIANYQKLATSEAVTVSVIAFLGLFLWLLAIPRLLGLKKPVMTLTPQGLAVSILDKPVPYSAIHEYEIHIVRYINVFITFYIDESYEGKKTGWKYRSHYNAKSGKLTVNCFGLSGLTAKGFIRLVDSYIEADAAANKLKELKTI